MGIDRKKQGEFFDRPQVSIDNFRRTNFDDLVVADTTFGFSFSSYEGISRLRNRVVEEDGATITPSDLGEIEMSTGADPQAAALSTNERGIYYPGGQLETGIGIRLNETPTGDQDVRWGYTSEAVNSGIGFGQDVQGLYLWLRRNGVDLLKIYQPDWNVDPLDGSGESGIDIDTTRGCIYENKLVWYGYGPIEWSVSCVAEGDINGTRQARRENNRILCHRFSPQTTDMEFDGPAVVNPNQPLSVKASNNGTAEGISVYVGGRQCSVLGVAEEQRTERDVLEPVVDYNLDSAEGVWTPIIALRRVETFGELDVNPTNIRIQRVQLIADEDVTLRTVWGADVTSAGWRAPDTWIVDGDPESAMEVQTIEDDGLTASIGDGFQIPPFQVVRVADQGPARDPQLSVGQDPTVLGRDEPVVIFARRDSSDIPEISVIATWSEEW